MPRPKCPLCILFFPAVTSISQPFAPRSSVRKIHVAVVSASNALINAPVQTFFLFSITVTTNVLRKVGCAGKSTSLLSNILELISAIYIKTNLVALKQDSFSSERKDIRCTNKFPPFFYQKMGIYCERTEPYTVKNFSGILLRQTRDIKWPSLDGVKLRMEWKLQIFRKFLSLIVKLHLVVNFTNCYCIIPNLVRNYT